MKKLAVVLLVAVASFCLASSAFAGSVSPGAVAKCTDAKSITVENKGGGAAGNKQVKMASKHSMGKRSVTFNRQNNFSRGDSISDINGVVKITNTGQTGLSVTCG